jgi:sialic acid synthase SpsE
MHCVSEYPTGPLLEQRGLKALSPEEVRLNMMRILMALFPQHKIGYSDHTVGILAPVAAVAMGAAVIEKHITLDRKTPVENFLQGKEYLGTDHVLSLEPAELREMVRQIREVEQMLGPWKWERSEGELILREFLRERFK